MSSTETIIEIPLEDLHDSPFQPRTTYSGLEELAASIKAQGRNLSPILVRPRIGPLFGSDPAAATGYEIIFGHRRRRSIELAGLATARCEVCAMTDAEVRGAQMAENVQRENMSALDEGAGYKAQIDAGDATADQIAEHIGKSRSHVYGRIKLLEVCGPVREQLLAGTIGSEVALLIARLRTPKLQEKALAAIRADSSQHSNLEDGGKKSFRHIRDMLAEKFTLELKSAIFEPEDEALLPGAGACSACPKRVGNAPEYSDLAAPTREGVHRGYTQAGGANVCTDPDCWDAKKQAHLQREADKLRAAGHDVVAGNRARQAVGARGEVKAGFVPLADFKAMLKTKPTAVQVVTIQNPRDGKLVKVVRTADLVQAGLIKAEEQGASKTSSHKNQYAQQEAARKAKEARAKVISAQRLALLRHVRAVAANRERDAFDLRLVAAAALGGVPWNDKDTLAALWGVKSADALTKVVDTMTVTDLTALLMDCALVDDVQVSWHNVDHSKPGPLLALANHYEIDVKAVMAAAIAPAGNAAPSPAGAGAKKAKAAPATKSARPVAYRCPATGSTWSGRGLKPAWLNAALAQGKTLSDFLVAGKPAKVMDEAGCAGEAAPADLLAEVAHA